MADNGLERPGADAAKRWAAGSPRAAPASRSSLLDEIDRMPGAVEPERPAEPPLTGPASADPSPLPKAGDDYEAHARPSNKPETSLFVMLKDGSYEALAWHSFDSLTFRPSDKPGEGPVLVVRFAGAPIRDLIVEGRNLFHLMFYLGQNRILWIRERPPMIDGKEPSATVITRIAIELAK